MLCESKVKEIQTLLEISDDDMKVMLSNTSSSKSFMQERQAVASNYSLNQMVNMLVYTILFTSLLYVVNRDTDGAVMELFKYFFPREATVLKLI